MTPTPELPPLAQPSRRDLLLGLGACLTCAACGTKANPPTETGDTSGEPSGDDGSEPQPFDACEPTPPAGEPGWVAVPLAEHPSLAVVGGGAAVDVAGMPLVLAQPQAGCFVAVSRICTHQGCEIAFVEGRFLCPCHGAAFDLDGSVLSGPTPVPVAAYRAAPGVGEVWVQTTPRS